MQNKPNEYRPLIDPIMDLRTSCTRDDAVGYLMGLLRLDPLRENLLSDDATPEEIELYDNVSVFDMLENDREIAETDYSNAKAEKLPDEVIAEKLAELQKCDSQLIRAHKFLCNIDDELAKGSASALRVDPRNTKNPDYPYITLSSLKEWVSKYPDSLNVTETPSSQQQKVKATPKARTRLRDQEIAIISEIKRLGYDPKKLPINPQGKDGVKAKVRPAMLKTELFGSDRVFEKTWGRLRDYKEITDVE